MNTEPWVTAEHVAQHLGVAKDTVYRWRERMGLPAHRVGRLWKLQLSKRDEWVRTGVADEEQHNEAPFRLLEPVPELSCGPADSGNLIVLGDNLHPLKTLLPCYAGQVKRIYIDPTYNTGQNDRGVDAQQTGWIFNNRVEGPEILDWLGKIVDIEAKDLCRHDNWLCMMCSRLRLLKDFLLDDGVTDRIGAIVQRLIQEGRIIFGENETKPVELKIYAKDYRVKLSRFFERGGRIGANEIQAIFPENKRPFGFPKSTELIEELLSFTTGDGGMTLDSFNGSGTTTNTALKQNRADRQTRRFILIEMKDAVGKAYQQALSDDDAASCGTVTDQYTFEFHAPAYAPIRDYNGRSEHFDFRKYFCGRIGDFASKAEFECTCHLEMWAQQECIKFWMSNLGQREHNLFFLQKAEGRLYPDFLCLLSGAETQSESTFTVEYKEANCWNGAEDDRLINGLRASLSEERCRFVIVKNKQWNWAEPLLT